MNVKHLELTVADGPDRGAFAKIADSGFIGSKSICDLILESDKAAPLNVRIRKTSAGYVLANLTALEDVQVNGRPVKSSALTHDDIITVAGNTITVGLVEGAVEKNQGPVAIASVATDSLPEPGKASTDAGPGLEVTSRAKAGQATPHRKKAPVLPFIIAGFVIGAIAIAFVLSMQHARRQMFTMYAAAVEFEEGEDVDYEAAMERYASVMRACGNQHRSLRTRIGRDIARLQEAQQDEKEALERLLIWRDRESKRHEDEGEYEAALGVYLSGSADDVARIREVRGERIAKLTPLAEKAAQDASEAAALREKQRMEAAHDALPKISDVVGRHLVAGKTHEAIELLKRAMSNRYLVDSREMLGEAVFAAKLLRTADEIAGLEYVSQDDPGFEKLPFSMRAVVVGRAGNKWLARQYLKRAESTAFLYAGIAKAIAGTEEERASERSAIDAFLAAWRSVLGEEVAHLPTPAVCLEQLTERSSQPAQEFLQQCKALHELGRTYTGTGFVKTYGDIFDAVAELPLWRCGLGEGAVVRVERTKYVVDTRVPLDARKVYTVGRFENDVVYTDPRTGEPSAAVVTVSTVYPAKPVDDHQLIVAVPEDKETRLVLEEPLVVRIGLRPGRTFLSREYGASGADRRRVVGIAADARHVLVDLPQPDLAKVKRGDRIRFIAVDDEGKIEEVGHAVMAQPVGDLLLCTGFEGQPGAKEIRIVLSGDAEDVATSSIGEGQLEITRAFGRVQDIGQEGVISLALDTVGQVPHGGLAAMAARVIRHPWTGEIVGVDADQFVPARFMQTGNAVRCLIGGGKTPPTKKGDAWVLVAGRPSETPVELLGWAHRCSSMSRIGGRPSWHMDYGKWNIVRSRYVNLPVTGTGDAIPVMRLRQPLTDFMQCSLDVDVIKSGGPAGQEDRRGLALELQFPETSVSLLLRASTGENRFVGLTGEKLAIVDDTTAFIESAEIATSSVAIEAGEGEGKAGLLAGRRHALRIRRLGDHIEFYINGITVASAQDKRFKGPTYLRVIVSAGSIGVGPAALQSLPRSCKTLAEGALLGSFGYVLEDDGVTLLVDADMVGASPGCTATVMAVTKAEQAGDSSMVECKPVGLVRCTSMGPRMARFTRPRGIIENLKGCKLIVGDTHQETFYMSKDRLADLNQGL